MVTSLWQAFQSLVRSVEILLSINVDLSVLYRGSVQNKNRSPIPNKLCIVLHAEETLVFADMLFKLNFSIHTLIKFYGLNA